jgi:hypothetical protein
VNRFQILVRVGCRGETTKYELRDGGYYVNRYKTYAEAVTAMNNIVLDDKANGHYVQESVR